MRIFFFLFFGDPFSYEIFKNPQNFSKLFSHPAKILSPFHESRYDDGVTVQHQNDVMGTH